MEAWICKECGQESSVESVECEICGGERKTSETLTKPKGIGASHFEIDGKKVAYAPSDNLSADRTPERGDFE